MSERVVIISEQQAIELIGVEYAPNSFCNPLKDGVGRWFIGVVEAEAIGLPMEVVDWIAPVETELPSRIEPNEE